VRCAARVLTREHSCQQYRPVAARGSGRRVRAGMAAGAVAPVVRGIFVAVEGKRFRGYSHVSRAISELGAIDAPTAGVHHATTVLSAALQLVFAGALCVTGRRRLGVVAGLGGAGLLGGSVFSPHTGLPLPGDASFSATDALHGFFGLLSGAGFAAEPLVGISDARLGRAHRTFSVAVAVPALLSATVSVFGVGRGAKGLLQRSFLIIVAAWQFPTALLLIRNAGASSPGHAHHMPILQRLSLKQAR
jgi:hypothetical protein